MNHRTRVDYRSEKGSKSASNGYPIPPKRVPYLLWVDGTPHYSHKAADDHVEILNLGKKSYNEYIQLLHDFLSKILTNPRHLKASDEALARAQLSAYEQYAWYASTVTNNLGDVSFMLERLLKDQPEVKQEPIFADKFQDIVDGVMSQIATLDDGPLKSYEVKLSKKYMSNSSVRTASGYVKQIKEKYLPNRASWLSVKMPDLDLYERAYALNKTSLDINISYDGAVNIASIVGFLDRARKTTFGGYPYVRNMGDFVSEDEADNTTYADLYNDLAINYLYLTPDYKKRISLDFVALERVQPGGVEDYYDGASLDDLKVKDNKQRFVQAQSAVISHAHKMIVDAWNYFMKSNNPTYASDKFGENAVTDSLKRIVRTAVGRDAITPEDTTLKYNIMGTDYDNFDATQDVGISNDSHYNNWRMLMPAWMTYYIIDPYVYITYASRRILVPKFGLIRTTGVGSGMGDTNQCDTNNCHFADVYELCWYSKHVTFMSDAEILTLMKQCMANGDDRAKRTPLGPDELEIADADLGFIANKTKQEVWYAGTPIKDMSVSYLKTIICLYRGDLIRTDSIGKLILSRVHPEKVSRVDHDFSLVLDCFMSASRSTESPLLYLYVDFMYEYLPVFRDLIHGKISLSDLLNRSVIEKMNDLVLTKGKKWMRRKGMDYDMIIEMLNAKYGYGDEGYRGTVGSISTMNDETGFANLPQVKAIMGLAYQRLATGDIGSSFRFKLSNKEEGGIYEEN